MNMNLNLTLLRTIASKLQLDVTPATTHKVPIHTCLLLAASVCV